MLTAFEYSLRTKLCRRVYKIVNCLVIVPFQPVNILQSVAEAICTDIHVMSRKIVSRTTVCQTRSGRFYSFWSDVVTKEIIFLKFPNFSIVSSVRSVKII